MTELVDKKVKIVTVYFICSKAKGETEQINENYILKKNTQIDQLEMHLRYKTTLDRLLLDKIQHKDFFSFFFFA